MGKRPGILLGFVEAGDTKLPIVRDQKGITYLAEHPDLVECPFCAGKSYKEYREIGYDNDWNMPMFEEFYSPLVVEKKGKLFCRGCKAEWIPPSEADQIEWSNEN